MLETGKIIRWTEKENSLGLMEENIKELIKMIKNKGTVLLFGQMEESIKDNG